MLNQSIQQPIPNDDDMPSEYDLGKIEFIRGKHAHLVGQPHTVTIHKGNGTASIQQFNGTGNITSEKQALLDLRGKMFILIQKLVGRSPESLAR